MRTTIILRTGNNISSIERTLTQINLQTAWVHLIAFDTGSTDGTRRLLEQSAEDVIDVPQPGYLPGFLLNDGMRRAKSDVVVFLNPDCSPGDEHWLERLLAPFSDAKVAAAYGRLLRRPGWSAAGGADDGGNPGDGVRERSWRNCFSAANAAIRKSVWQEMPFDETVRSSEDVTWGLRVQNAGHAIRYVPAAAVYVSQRGAAQPLRLHPPRRLMGTLSEQKETTKPEAFRPGVPTR